MVTWQIPCKVFVLRCLPFQIWIVEISVKLYRGFATAGMDVGIIAPEGFQPQQEFVDRARQRGSITVTDSLEAVRGADVVITDTWVSMGQEADGLDRRTPFIPYENCVEIP